MRFSSPFSGHMDDDNVVSCMAIKIFRCMCVGYNLVSLMACFDPLINESILAHCHDFTLAKRSLDRIILILQ